MSEIVELADARRALRDLTASTVALVTAIPDLGIPMSGSEWTVGEAAAHLVYGAVDYAEHARGTRQCYRIDLADAARSQRRIHAEMLERGSHELGVELQRGVAAFLDATEGRAGEDQLPFHLGTQPCATMTGLLLGEQLLHGYDMAQALSVAWPIDAEHARLVVHSLLPLLPFLVDSEAAKGVDATYELTVGDDHPVMAQFRDGTGSINSSGNGTADCRLSGDPIAWLMALYGRADWAELLRMGRVTVTGGDATLGAGLKQLLRNP